MRQTFMKFPAAFFWSLSYHLQTNRSSSRPGNHRISNSPPKRKRWSCHKHTNFETTLMRARGRWTFRRGWVSRCAQTRYCATETIRSKNLVIIQILVAVISQLITLPFEYHCSPSAERWPARIALTEDLTTTHNKLSVFSSTKQTRDVANNWLLPNNFIICLTFPAVKLIFD